MGPMVTVKIDGRKVDVADRRCAERDCFQLGFDKGTFVQGRGYTNYHAKERPVCMTRHLHGCPTNSVCPKCRLLSVEEPGAACRGFAKCGGITVSKKEDV